MMTFNFLRPSKVALASILALMGCLLFASAQDGPDKQGNGLGNQDGKVNPEASRFDNNVYPDLRSPSAIRIKRDGHEIRVVGISHQSPTAAHHVNGLRFHKILGALVERDIPVEKGLPPIIEHIRREPDGSVWLSFTVLVTTPEFQKRCRDAVCAQERQEMKAEKLTADDITVKPWPLIHCVITMQDSSNGEILGVAQTGSLVGIENEFTYKMQLSHDDLPKILELIKKGEAEFVYTYSYVGSTSYSGSVNLRGAKNAKLMVRDKLRADQLNGRAPIFQAEANDAVRFLNLSVQKIVRASHKDLLPLLDQPILYQKLFTSDGEITFADLRSGNGATEAMLVAYLKPHLEQIRESFGDEKSDITIHEGKVGQGEIERDGVNVGIGLPLPIGLSIGGNHSRNTTKPTKSSTASRKQRARSGVMTRPRNNIALTRSTS